MTDLMKDCGLLFVATTSDAYVAEAFLSAAGVKELAPSLHITLFTDRPQHPLCATGVFDRVETLAGDGPGQLRRIEGLMRTPYERTLYLDSDTRVLTPAVAELFARLDGCDLALVEDSADFSFARSATGQRMFNCGVILYRNTPAALDCLETWRARFARNLTLAQETALPAVAELAHVADEETRRRLLRIDKIALMEIIRPGASGPWRVETLKPSWNYRGQTPLPGTNIIHAHARTGSAAADILDIALAWTKAGHSVRAQALYDYVGAIKPVHQMRAYWPLAVTTNRNGEEWATAALKRADLHITYGHALEAAAILNGISGERPHVLTGYARLALADGAGGDALRLSGEARALAPQSSYAAIIHGAALLAAQKPNDAIAVLTQAAKERPAASFLLGLAWAGQGNFREAAVAYRKAVDFDPTDPGPANNLLPALLGDRKYAAAISHAENLLAQRPGHTAALAFKSISLAEQGRARDLEALIDFGLIKSETLAVPPGYADIAAFNRALAQEIAAERTLAYERNTTRFGYQTDDIGAALTPAVRALNAVVLEAARRRAQDIDRSAGHPFASGVPRDFRVYSWGVVMQEHGHQAPHFHPHGWLSGVYYIEVPPEISERDAERHGWIEFGRGDDRWHRKGTAMPTYQVLPQEGRLLTFPSYFWHNTRPLRTPKRRISFAFDIIPLT